jgi:hypothetical protein
VEQRHRLGDLPAVNSRPAVDEGVVGEVDTEGGAEGSEVVRDGDLAALVALVRGVEREARLDRVDPLAGEGGPAGKRPREVDLDDHTAEVEEERAHVRRLIHGLMAPAIHLAMAATTSASRPR